MDIVVSFYKFKRLNHLPELKADIEKLAREQNLKGTVLLAAEGINASIMGHEGPVRHFLNTLQADSRIGSFMEEKSNPTDLLTHKRMLVKIKKEIVTMHKENLIPEEDTGSYLTPEEFKKWCDEGKEMILVDTRNDYEVSVGTFKGALDPKTKSFGEFPEWLEKNLSHHKDSTIVTYCTGGIRCEKATAYMKKEGYKDVYQIKGGILQYFADLAKNGDAPYWEGDCVVFDKRLAVAPDLHPTRKELCFHCFTHLNPDNKVEIQMTGGFLCKTCYGTLESRKRERQEIGKKHAEEFRKRRAEHCLETRRRFMLDSKN